MLRKLLFKQYRWKLPNSIIYVLQEKNAISGGKELASKENAFIWDSVLVSISSVVGSFC